MLEADLAALREEIAALSVHKNSRRYPAPLREKIARWARQRRAAGAAVARICAELDIGVPTLHRFLGGNPRRQRRHERRKAFTQLKVVEHAVQRSTVTTAPLMLRAPLGVVVEGLSIADLSRLLRELSCSV